MTETETPATAGTVDRGDWIEASNAGDPNPPQAENHEAVASLTGTTNDTLARIAQQIKALEKDNIRSVIEIGRLLHQASEQPNFMKWLKTEFAWSYMTAKRYRDVFDLSENYQIGNFQTLNISISALYLVAHHINDQEAWARDASEDILEAARKGRVTYRAACAIFQEHKKQNNKNNEPRIVPTTEVPDCETLLAEFKTLIEDLKQSKETGDIEADDVRPLIDELIAVFA